jgi:hypothetical protein
VDRAASSAAARDWCSARVEEAGVSFGPGDENNAEKPGAMGVAGTHNRHTRLLASCLAIEMAPMDKAESTMASLRSPLCHYSPRSPRRTRPAGICRAAALLCAREYWLLSQSRGCTGRMAGPQTADGFLWGNEALRHNLAGSGCSLSSWCDWLQHQII